MAKKDSKKKNLKINVIDGACNQKASRRKSKGITDAISVENKMDNVIRSSGQVDIIAIFNELFDFDTVSSDDLTIYQAMSIGHQTENGKIPRIYVLKDSEGVEHQVNETMMKYICPHNIIIGEGKKRYVKHMTYPVGSDDPAYSIYKASMIPHGWKLGRCSICQKIELVKDESVDEADRASISDILMQATLAIETIKSLYAVSIHKEIATITEEDNDIKNQIVEQQEMLRQFSGQLAYNLASISKDLDQGLSIEEKAESKNADEPDILSSYGVDSSTLFNKKK